MKFTGYDARTSLISKSLAKEMSLNTRKQVAVLNFRQHRPVQDVPEAQHQVWMAAKEFIISAEV